MSSIEALKEQARRHEQKEEWPKALELYNKAIQKLAAAEQPDIGLYNRVADIQVRQGQIDKAVVNYEQAIDLYAESELPNNAIAVCKKIVRNMPQRHSVYLRMGQIRGQQGFVTEARQNFLIYAERMQAEGNIDEALRALTELADIVPEDVDIRLAIATQMLSHDRGDDAIEQLQRGYGEAARRGLDTGPFEAKLRELGQEPRAVAPLAFETTALAADDGFGDIVLAEPGPAAAEPPPPEPPTRAPAAPPVPPTGPDVGIEVGAFEIAVPAGEPEEPEEPEDEVAAVPLPTFGFGADQEGVAGDEDELPLLAFDDEEEPTPLPLLEPEEEPTPLPLLELDEEPAGAELDAAAFGERDLGERETSEYVDSPAEMPEIEIGLSLEGAVEEARAETRARPVETDPMGHESLAARGDLDGAMGSLRRLIRTSPDDLALRQRLVDYAGLRGDRAALVAAWTELAETLERLGQGARARPVWERVIQADPTSERARRGLGQVPPAAAPPSRPPAEDFVDLGSMLLDDEGEKTTRFVVAYEEPSGDEQADFAKMLSQFKAKVAANLGSDDVKAHHDLGTAYKEMGLLDEAISEFQQALRASADHLPTFEVLGQCFMEKGEPEAAVRTLKRALEIPFEIEDELLGIYYHLGRAYQVLGNKDQAVEFYDRVFSLDINFADVTERLRALR